LSLYKIPEDRVSVIYLSHDSLATLPTEESPSSFRIRLFGADVPYLLYVGSRTPYKNFKGLLSAYTASPWLRSNFHLLCFGGGAFTVAEQASLAHAGVVRNVLQVGGPDELLANCYRNAAVFAYPSLYEGFGLPPLEAMSLGCPVVCSDASSIPEVVGDAAVMFDPGDTDAIRAALEGVLGSIGRKAELVARGARRSSLFGWRRCAQETVEVYRRIATS
jgi:glycosyltransferase involved in cell wall biosynthesis